MKSFPFLATVSAFRCFGVTFALVASAWLAPGAHSADVNKFIEFNYDVPNWGSATVELPGRLLIPPDYSPNQSYPLVVHYHGSGERGKDNVKQVCVSHIDNLVAAAESNGFFLYAPQAPENSYVEWPDYSVRQSLLKVAEAVSTYNIDQSKIYFTGISMGGGGTWRACSIFPHVFAAAIPICGASGHGPFNPAALVGLPIWAFHAEDDLTDGATVSASRNRINEIRAQQGLPTLNTAGFNALPGTPYWQGEEADFHDVNELKYTEFTSGGHGIWGAVYAGNTPQLNRTYPLYDWMLSKSREITPPAVGETVLFDFGPTGINTADSQGRIWNTLKAAGPEQAAYPVWSYAVTSGGGGTSLTLEVVAPFQGASNNGTTTSPLYAEQVSRDAWTASGTAPSRIRLRGLEPDALYDLKFYASTNESNKQTRYQIAGTSQFADLDPQNNQNNQVTIAGVAADSSGIIDIDVGKQPSTSSNAGRIGALEIIPAGSSAPPPIFAQDFGSSTNYLDYVAAPPAPSDKITDIGQQVNGGVWSISGGKLQLLRGVTTSDNAASFTRVPDAAAPTAARLSFKLKISGSFSGWQTLVNVQLGQVSHWAHNSVGWYSVLSSAFSITTAGNVLQVKTSGVAAGALAPGSENLIVLYSNRSGGQLAYERPDNGQQKALAHNHVDIWVNDALTLPDMAQTTQFLSDAMGGFRFQFVNGQACTVTVDYIHFSEL
jgi:poly(3-hydroxybutyrate) depolymerase